MTTGYSPEQSSGCNQLALRIRLIENEGIEVT